MGFLREDERASLRIESMILHVVGGENFEISSEQPVEHEDFFIERILETDSAGVYEFKEVSRTRDYLQQMARGEISFEAGAQEISREFARWHVGAASDGAFFIFELRTENDASRIYSLIKYDYKQVIERSEDGGQRRLRRIVNAFVDDKRSIQKSALIRVVGGVAEPMLATLDRNKKAPEIVEYFATFLDVFRTRSDEELNRKLVNAVREALAATSEHLPNNDVATAVQRVKGILRDRAQIDEAAIMEAVLAAAGHPEDPEIRDMIGRKTAAKLRSNKLAGLTFSPVPNILRKPSIKKLRTTEGVTVTYPFDVDAVMVTRIRNAHGTGETITITTDQVVEDVVIEDRS